MGEGGGGRVLPLIRVALEKAGDQEPDKKTSSPTVGPPFEFFFTANLIQILMSRVLFHMSPKTCKPYFVPHMMILLSCKPSCNSFPD